MCKNGAGAAFVLTGYAVACVARAENGSPNEINLAPEIVAPATDGKIRLEFTDEELEVLLRPHPDGRYVFDLVLQDSNGDKLPPTLAGVITITSDISR
jgi:hypothetical protein